VPVRVPSAGEWPVTNDAVEPSPTSTPALRPTLPAPSPVTGRAAPVPSNPVCYVCADGGLSTITKPDTIVQLPPEVVELTGGVTEASCSLIQNVTEELRLVPEEFCPLLDVNSLKLVCGCTNAIPTIAPVVTPSDATAVTTEPNAAPVTPSSDLINDVVLTFIEVTRAPQALVPPTPEPTRSPLAEGETAMPTTPEPPCYLCFDGQRSRITKPDAIYILPETPLLPDTATCEEIRRVLEDDQLLPAELCPMVDNPLLRQVCGCENVPETTFPPTPSPNDVAQLVSGASTKLSLLLLLGIVVGATASNVFSR